MAKSLTERLRAALSPNARAADVAQLIGIVAKEIEAATAEQARFHAIAIDAGTDDEAAETAADAEFKASRRIVRLKGQHDQLTDRLADLEAAERRREAEAYEREVTAERDRLAEDLRREWPLIEARIQHLLWRIIDVDRRCGNGIVSAEAIARGCSGAFSHMGMPLQRLTDVTLPSFDVAASAMHGAWPPERRTFDRALIDKSYRAELVEETGKRVASLEAGNAQPF